MGRVRELAARRRGVDLACIVLLVLVAFTLRLHQYSRIPYPNETADEYAFVWSGWSWLHDGAPTSWSWKEAYGPAPRYFANHTLYQLVTPWLDHPPLYSLLVGAAVSLSSARELLDAPLAAARLTAVCLGALATALVYAVARATYGRLAALAAAALFATVPTIVLASRLVVAESLLVVLLLAAVLAAQRYARTTLCHPERGERSQQPTAYRTSTAWLGMAIAASALAPLAKVPGVAVGASAALLLASAGRRRAALLALAAPVAGLVPYVAYGWAVDWPLFRALIADQSNRSTGVEVLGQLLTGASIGPVSWHDAWMPVLWLALVYATFRRDRVLMALVVPYLLVLVAVVDQSVPRVWYRIPLFPALCLAGGVFVRDSLVRPDPIRATILVFGLMLPKLAESFKIWDVLGDVPGGQRVYPLLIALLAVPIVATAIWSSAARRWARLEVGMALLVTVFASGVMVWRADHLYPEYHPNKYEEVAVPTHAGASVRRYWAEPDVLTPGGSVRVSTVWRVETDAGATSSIAAARPFDPRTRAYGTPTVRGSAAEIKGKRGDEVTVDYTIAMPTSRPEADYDLGVEIGGEFASLGIVRVRAR